MAVLFSVALFILAGLAEIGGGWLVWQGLREHRGLAWVLLGAVALFLYGIVPTFQPIPHFGRVYAAYGAFFIVLSLLWGRLVDGWRPDAWDVTGAAIALAARPSCCGGRGWGKRARPLKKTWNLKGSGGRRPK